MHADDLYGEFTGLVDGIIYIICVKRIETYLNRSVMRQKRITTVWFRTNINNGYTATSNLVYISEASEITDLI
jgi:hypothetical protein